MCNRIATILIIGLSALISACSGSSGGTVFQNPNPTPSQMAAQIQHVVIIFQENRTVDNLFYGFPGADTVTSGKTSTGATVALHPVSLAAPYDLDHSHTGFVTGYNGGNMNGFDLENISPDPGYTPK